MSINVKLFATLRENRFSKKQFDFQEGLRPKDIISSLNMGLDEVAILLINGIYSPAEKSLQDKDTLSLFPPVGGG